MHEDYGFGYDIEFEFQKPNPYFLENIITKTFRMARANVIEKCESTKINWKEGCNPTIKRVKKKRGGKRVLVEVPNDSFFTFFDQIRMPSDEELKDGNLIITRTDLETEDASIEKEGPQSSSDGKKNVEEPGEYIKPEHPEEDLGERIDRDY